MNIDEVIKAIQENRAYKIYKSKEFKRLKKKVLKEFHFECSRCKDSGIITRATTVHHIKEVKHYPELAFQEFYIDKYGIRQRNLIPLCADCHNAVHHRFGYRPNQTHKKKEEFINEERW